MKVFLSWSGDRSREIATALHDWIPYVVQCARPFISAGDIEKGRRWNDVLGAELSESSYGIICITRDNANAPWLHFEAGAISKALNNSCVSPFLFDLEPDDIPGPFQQFQSTVFREHDVLSLMHSINTCAPPELQVSPEVLKNEFDAWWPKLKAQLSQIPAADTRTHTGYDWLYTIDDLMAKLTPPESKTVWWVTPDPYSYALLMPSKALIMEQLQAGVNWTFVVPAAEEMDVALAGLGRLGAGKPGLVHINAIPKEPFRKAVVTDYLIVDPESAFRVFLELPAAKRGFWIRVDDEAAALFVSRFTELQKLAARAPQLT